METPQTPDSKKEQAPKLLRKARELTYLNQQNIIEDEQQPQQAEVPIRTSLQKDQIRQQMEKIALARRLAHEQRVMNLDSLKVPSLSFIQNKQLMFENMRLHETEVKNYLRGKITNLKEDIIQGQLQGATKRYLQLEAIVDSQDSEWLVKILGKVDQESQSFVGLFEKIRFSFDNTHSYMPVEWVKSKCNPAQAGFDGLQIRRNFLTDPQFVLKVSFSFESSPKRFLVSSQLNNVLGIQEETRAKIVSALWQYIKSNRLQDPEDRRFINLNSALQGVFGNQIERIEFHQIISLLKSHLTEPKPLEIQLNIERGAGRQIKKFTMPVYVQSQHLQDKLQFLVDHDYNFEPDQQEQEETTAAGELKRREAKCNRKIAGLVEKMKRSAAQMEFYESMASSKDLTKNLQGVIVTQNKLLRMLQEEPDAHKFGSQAYQTKPGQSQLKSATQVETNNPKFFTDNKQWIVDEIEGYLQNVKNQKSEEADQLAAEESQQ